MILATVISKNGVPIRLTDERWLHILSTHSEIIDKDQNFILKTIRKPDMLLEGDVGEILAVKKRPRKQTWIVIPYKEINKIDGFILTAYLTTDSSWLFHRKIIWNKE